MPESAPWRGGNRCAGVADGEAFPGQHLPNGGACQGKSGRGAKQARPVHFSFRGRPRGFFGATSCAGSAVAFGGRPGPGGSRSTGGCRKAIQFTPSASASATTFDQPGSLAS